MTAPAMQTVREKLLPVLSNTVSAEKSCAFYKTRRPSRAKRHIRWEEYVQSTHRDCGERLHRIAKRFPDLTPQQLRIAVLVAEMLTTEAIARILGVTERAVEKVRSRIRIKLAIDEGIHLAAFLLSVDA